MEFDDIFSEDELAGVDIVGLDPDMEALVDDMLEREGIAGDDSADYELEDLISGVGDVEIGRRKISRARLNRFIMGRVRRLAKRGIRTAALRQQKQGFRGRPTVRTSAPSGAETGILAFQRDTANGGNVAAGATVEVTAEPQRAFKPEALIIDETTAPDFLVTEIKIGTKTLFVNTGGVPASMFKADGVLGRLLLNKTGQVSQQLTIRVRNISASARPFYAAMVGWSAD